MFLVVIIVVVAAAVVVHRRGRRELGCWLCSWCCSRVGRYTRLLGYVWVVGNP